MLSPLAVHTDSIACCGSGNPGSPGRPQALPVLLAFLLASGFVLCRGTAQTPPASLCYLYLPVIPGEGTGAFAPQGPKGHVSLSAAWPAIKGCLSSVLGAPSGRRYRNAKHCILFFFFFLGKWPRKVTKRDRNAKK